MQRAADVIRLSKGPRVFLARVIARAIADLEQRGLTLAVMTHAEFMAANAALTERGWYPLHDHYGHHRFLGLAITDTDLGRIFATAVSRPLDLGDRSVGQAYEDLHFPYPAGVPVTAKDRFENIPVAAYGLKGVGSYVGGYWIDPEARRGSGLGNGLRGGFLSYLTRPLYAWILGTEDPDFLFGIAIDELLLHREVGKSIYDSYGWRNAAPGPNWVNHYPDADLPINTIWQDRAGILETLDAAPWVTEKRAWEHPMAPRSARAGR